MAFALPHIFFLLFLLPFSAIAQPRNGNFTAGASLSAAINSSSWLSPSGDFAFGFRQIGDQDSFLLSIWYAKIPDKTIVWYANKDEPAPVGSTVEIISDRGLVLKDPTGKELWNSESIIGRVSYGFMNNTGNFQLISGVSEVLWETFQHPTDTLLPTQVMDLGELLSSRRSENNFSTGRFQLLLQQDGNLVLASINLPSTYANRPYYASGTNDLTNSSNAGQQLIFSESGNLYILKGNGQTFNFSDATLNSSQDLLFRATLNFDGVFALYKLPKNFTVSENWSNVWSLPDNICTPNVDAGSGTCGYNSVCRLNVDKRPTCECPRGYSLLDPNDSYGDCKPDFLLTCGVDEPYSRDLYDIVTVTNTDWPFSDYALLSPFTDDQCKEACMSDCMCAVSVFGEGNKCWKKRIPLSNGKLDRSVSRRTYIKVGKGKFPPLNPNSPNSSFPDTNKNQDTIILVGSVLLGGSVFVNFILLGAICFVFFFVYNKKLKQAGSNTIQTNLRCFTYKELSDVTDGFKEEVGRGASGIVYKGKIQADSGSSFVAVKKLDRVVEDGKEFKTEMNIIGQTHHKNLVRLLGFCDEGSNRLLVYEFLSNGTLASLLFGDLRPSWSQRIQIAFGISRGLLYLHEECATQIIHCDIKPQNILLDDYYNVRISDFGLSKILMLDQSQTHTGIRGTKGYLAPEWFRFMPVTAKVDVYSFGVLLLEIICCRKCVHMESDSFGPKSILTDWAYECYCEGTLHALVENDAEAMKDLAKVEKFVMVALWCIQEDPHLRPTMRKVTQMLEGIVEVKAPPISSPYSISVTEKE